MVSILILMLQHAAISNDIIIDGSSQESFQKSLSKLSTSLDEKKSAQFMKAYMKIAKSLNLGKFESQEDARQKINQAMSKILDGKSFKQIVAMAQDLPDDPQTEEVMKDMKQMGTSSDYQHDADIVRLKHLKYLGSIIEEYKAKTEKYPLQNNTSIQNYVHIASPLQQKYAQDGPPFEHIKTDVSKFQSELEKGLGRKVNMLFDTQLVPVNKNFFPPLYSLCFPSGFSVGTILQQYLKRRESPLLKLKLRRY